MFTIRVATEIDEAAAQSLAERVFTELRRIYVPKGSASAVATAGTRLIAEIEGRIAGTVLYTTESDRLHLRGLAVEPAERRTGLGRALVDHLAGLATAAGRRALSLYTIKQTGNVLFFERLGFRTVSEEAATWATSVGGEDLYDVYMERPLKVC